MGGRGEVTVTLGSWPGPWGTLAVHQETRHGWAWGIRPVRACGVCWGPWKVCLGADRTEVVKALDRDGVSGERTWNLGRRAALMLWQTWVWPMPEGEPVAGRRRVGGRGSGEVSEQGQDEEARLPGVTQEKMQGGEDAKARLN